MNEETKGLKIYDVYVKYIEITMDDGEVLIYEAYSPFPKGHAIESGLVKLSLKDAMTNINSMNDEDGLRMDYHGSTAYAPSTVKKVRWSKDDDIAKGTYVIDISGSKKEYKLGSVITIGKNSYQCKKIINWTDSFKTKFFYCIKVLNVVKPDVDKAVKAVKKESKKAE